MIKIYSIIPLLTQDKGHAYPYNLSVEAACTLNGWEHSALIPKQNNIANLPKNWKKILFSFGLKRTFFQKLITLFANIPLYFKFLKGIQKSAKKQILFMEQFGLPDFLSLSLAILLSSPKIELWLLYRYDPKLKKMNLLIYQAFHKLLSKKLGSSFKLFTDSALLQKSQKQVFQQEIYLLPIPHTTDLHYPLKQPRRNSTDLLLWWPTVFIDKARGLDEIKLLSKSSLLSDQEMKLVVSIHTAFHLKNSHLPTLFLNTPLPRSEYTYWMNAADIILLPYNSKSYLASTSGIFVEAIIAGSMPVVSKNTWMAYEYERFNLKELILDWQKEDLLHYLKTLPVNSEVSSKLNTMQTNYRLFHSVERLAHTFKDILSDT